MRDILRRVRVLSKIQKWRARNFSTMNLSQAGWPFHAIAGRVGFVMIPTMTNIAKEAIEVLRGLPEDRQETIARAILDFASHTADEVHGV